MSPISLFGPFLSISFHLTHFVRTSELLNILELVNFLLNSHGGLNKNLWRIKIISFIKYVFYFINQITLLLYD